MSALRIRRAGFLICVAFAVCGGCAAQVAAGKTPNKALAGASDAPPPAAGVSASPALYKSVKLPLRVAEFHGIARAGEPVRGGIPLPKGAYFDVDDFYIEGVSQFQFEPLVYWPDGSIRWMLALFDATVPANGESVYRLRADGRTKPAASPLGVSESDAAIEVDTGPLRFRVRKQRGFNLFDHVSLNGYEIVSSSDEGGIHVVAEHERRQFSSAREPREYRVEVLERGPVRACLRARGWHGNAELEEHAFYGFDVVLCAYAGRSFVSVDFALENRPYWEPRGPLAFVDLDLRLVTNLASDKTVTVFGDSERSSPMGAAAFITQHSAKEFRSHATEGRRALGWMDVADGARGVAAGIKYFWESYPNAIEASSDGTLDISPFPLVDEQRYYLQDLTRKIYKTAFYFHEGTAEEANVQAVLGGFLNHPLHAVPSRHWLSDTRAVLGDLAPPSGKTKHPSMPVINDHLGGKRYREGWYHFGYSPYFNDDNAREIMHTEGIAYMATLNPKDFLALEAAVQMEGLKPYHVSEDFETMALFSSRQSSGPNPNGFSHKEYLDSPESPRWAAHPTDPVYWGAGTVGEQGGWRERGAGKAFAWIVQDPGHMDVRHVVDYYCLTGDVFAKDMVRSAGEFRGMFNSILANSPDRLGAGEPKISRSISATAYNLATYYFLFPEPRIRTQLEVLAGVYSRAAGETGHFNQIGPLDYEHLRPFYEAIATYTAVLLYELTANEAFKSALEANARAYYQLIEPNGYMRFNEKSAPQGPVEETSTSNYRVFDAVTGLMQFVPGHEELQERLAYTLASWKPKIMTGKRRGWFQKYLLRLDRPQEFDRNPFPTLLGRIAGDAYEQVGF